jgi:hypothetical protein
MTTVMTWRSTSWRSARLRKLVQISLLLQGWHGRSLPAPPVIADVPVAHIASDRRARKPQCRAGLRGAGSSRDNVENP